MVAITLAGQPINLRLGENTDLAMIAAGQAAGSASSAAVSAAAAQAVVGPNYASTAAGLAATTNGQSFAVDNGAGTVTIWRNVGGAAVAQRTLATTAALAATTGAGLIGWIQAGANAVLRAVNLKLRETVTPMDFGAVGDADPDNNATGTDDTVAVQRALDYLATTKGGSLDLAGKFYKVQNVRIPERGQGRRWFIFGRGGGFVNPATATTQAPCLFHSSLAASGAATRTYQYSTGVTLDGVNFHGGGFGVGYAHYIAGHLHHTNCSFQKLEDGLLTIGVAGVTGLNTRALDCKRAFHCPLIVDYTFTAGYTEESSFGWNDGYSLRGGTITRCERGLVHKGSANEGVVSVSHMIWAVGEQSYVETYGVLKAVEIHNNWCEFTKAQAGTGAAVADCIRLYRSTGADSGGESPGRYTIRHNHFFLSAPSPVATINTYAVRRVIDARVNCHIHDNTFTAATGGLFDLIIYNAIGSSGTPIPKASITANSTASLVANGFLGFADADLAQFGDVQSILFFKHDNGKRYALAWRNQPSVGTQNYDVHAVTPVFSPQFSAVSVQWGVKTSQEVRVAPTGFAIDFDTNVTGLAVPAGAVDVWSGMNGGIVDAAGNGTGGLIQIERNVCQNIDMRLFYAQTNVGRYIMRDNIKRA